MHVVWELPLSSAGVIVETDSGTRLRIRPVRIDDGAALVEAYERLSPESRYQRFFTGMAHLSDSMTSSLTEIDHRRHLAWAVFDPERESAVGDDSGLAVAVARLIADGDDTATAEAALTVVDDYQRRGIGRFLIELLFASAAQVGVTTLRFEVLVENRAMRSVLDGLGAQVRSVPGDPAVVHHLLPVPAPDQIDAATGPLYDLLRVAVRGSGEEDGNE